MVTIIDDDDGDFITINITLDERSIHKLKLVTCDFNERININIRNDSATMNVYSLIEKYRTELKLFEHGLSSCLIPVGLALKIVNDHSPTDVKLVSSIYNESHDIVVLDAHIEAHQKYITNLNSIIP